MDFQDGSLRPLQPLTARQAYRDAWKHLRANFWVLVGVQVMSWLLGYGSTAISKVLGLQGLGYWPTAVDLAYTVLVVAPLWYGGSYVSLRAARGERPQFRDMFAAFSDRYVPAVVSGALIFLLVIAGLVLLVIPGLVLLIRLSFVPYLVIDEGMGPIQALRISWGRSRGHFWRISRIIDMGVLLVLVGLILLVVGVVPTVAWMNLALARFYLAHGEGNAGGSEGLRS